MGQWNQRVNVADIFEDFDEALGREGFIAARDAIVARLRTIRDPGHHSLERPAEPSHLPTARPRSEPVPASRVELLQDYLAVLGQDMAGPPSAHVRNPRARAGVADPSHGARRRSERRIEGGHAIVIRSAEVAHG